MDIKKLQTVVVNALEDVKAQDIRLFNTEHLTSLFDRIVIASGTSSRQTKALASSVHDNIKENGGNIISIEGADTGEWVLVDLGDMVVHIMQPAIRDYYRLEEIWGEKEIKLAATKRPVKKTASTPPVAASSDESTKKTVRKTATRKAADTATATGKKSSPKKQP